ncbi:hypothetical protein JOF53_004446 [Crossiella equi]|uniref:Oxidoreductase n=1 Tax=Crossiella equi TaxID=130796 RepID=A0ABS5AG64_9PSEU|nr:hypothetical protein [Crossiella equi]MBP2475574.1 hypothetical protein [Crossiella equi]
MDPYPKPSDFTEAERAVCRAFAVGRQLVLPVAAGADTRVRASLLCGLLTGLYRLKPAGVPALRLTGATITGRLDLEALDIRTLVELSRCTFDTAPDLRMAHLVGLRLPGCRLPGIKGRNLQVDSDLVLEAGFTATGCVDLTDATVRGTLRLAGAVLRSPQDHALLGARLRISGSLQATAMRATGEVRLRGATVSGNVHLGGAHLSNPGGDALEGSGIAVNGNLFCDGDGGRFTASGRVVLAGSHIGGDAVFTGARLQAAAEQADSPVPLVPHGSPRDAASLVADRLRVDGNVKLDDGFTSAGSVRLPNAAIGGYLRMVGATLGSEDVVAELEAPGAERVGRVPVALFADGIEVRGDLEARGFARRHDDGEFKRVGGMTAYGQVRLVDAHVHGSASLSGVHLHGPGTDVLFADRIKVGGTLFLRDLRARGSVRLQNAAIGSTLDCSGARLVDPRRREDGSIKPSLDARVATVGKDLLCSWGMVAEGGVRFRLVEVGKMVTFTGSRLGRENGEGTEIALNAYGLSAQQLVLRFGRKPYGRVLLTRANVVSVTDGKLLWQATGGVELEDFAYQGIAADPDVDVKTRLAWLRAVVPDYAPGPYEQLASVYRDGGHEELAERVLLEKQRRRFAELGIAGRLWGLLQEVTVGYGYRPWLALLWLLVFWVLGGVWFTEMYTANPQPWQYPIERLDSDQNPVWNPWLLSADMLLPIVTLGQDNMWRITGASQWITVALTAVGWILASTAAAGATRVLKRN